MIERRWPENVDSDWAIDCSSPMSANTSRNTGSTGARLGRDVEPGLVHQGEQPEGAQRDRLAAGVGARDDERRVAVAEPEVDRHDAPGEPRVARREQDDLLVRRPRAGRIAVQLRGQLRLGRPEVELGERLERLARASSRWRPTSARQLVEDPALLLVDRGLRLAPGVAQLHDDERLDEQRLAAARRVVDDALDADAGLGPDRARRSARCAA